ncbi:hypothetical protein ABZ923_31890, partial [Streptomyces sp. NPDC046881]
VDDFESDRREWVPLKLVPDMIARGEPAGGRRAGGTGEGVRCPATAGRSTRRSPGGRVPSTGG